MPKKLTITALRERISEICNLVKTKKIKPDDAINEVFGRKKIKRGTRAVFRAEINKLVNATHNTNEIKLQRQASSQKLLSNDEPLQIQELATPFLIGNIREALRRNENLVQRNSNLALRETVRTLEKLDSNNHLEIVAEIERLRKVHEIVDMFNLESSLSEIRNRTDYLVDEEDSTLRAAASCMLVSTNTGFQGFNIETFNGEENDFNSEDSITEESSEQIYPQMEELEELEHDAEKEDALEFEAEKYLMEIFNVLDGDEKLLFLESIYLNPENEGRELRKLSRCLANMTSDNNDKVNDFPLDKTTSELINALEILGGTLHMQLIDLKSKRSEEDNSFDLPSLLEDTGSVLLEDDDIEETELNDKERALEFEAIRQEVFLVTVEEELIEPSIGEFLELYDIAACEQVRERFVMKILSKIENNDDKNFLSKMFLNDLDPERNFPKEDGIRKYNALHHAVFLLGKKAKPLVIESLRSENVEIKCAAFDVLLNGKLTSNWGKEKLTKEIIESCKTGKNLFLLGRLLFLSREKEEISCGLRENCQAALKKVLSEKDINFTEIMKNLEGERVCTYEIANVTEMHYENLTDTNEIKLLPINRSLLATLLEYELLIEIAYDSKDSNPILSKNAQAVLNEMLPEDKQERIETLQILIAGSKSREKLLALADLSGFGKDVN